MKLIFQYILTFFGFCVVLFGASGALDSRFDDDGVVITNIYSSDDTIFNILTLDDGKKIVVGDSNDGQYNIALMRLDTNGLPDETYGKDAKVKYPNSEWKKYSVTDGNDIYVACRSNNGRQFEIYDFESDGTLNQSFGSGGIVSTNFDTNVTLYAIVVNDSVLYAAGKTEDNNLFIAKFSASNGSLITSFGTNGLYVDNSYTSSQINEMVLSNSHSKLYVSGKYIQASDKYLFVRSYNLFNDSIETSFGTNGTASYSTAQSTYPQKIALQSDGKIVISAIYDDVTFGSYLIRYDSNGTLDSTYANSGTISLDNNYLTDFFIDANDDVVTHITYNVDSLQPDGKLVKFSSSDGSLISSTPTMDSYYSNITSLANNKILLASSKNEDFNFSRYLSNGAVDTSYGSNGELIIDFNDQSEYARDIVVQNDGKIVVTGVSNNGVNDDFFVARYNSDGSLDSSFGNGGKVTTDFQGSSDKAEALALQSDGKIVVVGYTDIDTHKDIAIARYNTNGTLDTSFDSDGKVWSNIENNDTLAYSVVIDSSNNIVIGGTINSFSSVGYDFLIARYTPTGQLDSSFGSSSGYSKSDMGSDNEGIIKLLKYSNGFYAIGDHYNDSSNSMDNDILIKYYLNNGTEDATPENAIHISNEDEKILDATLDKEGRIIIVGALLINGNNSDQLVIRFRPTQGIDTTFANGTGWISIDTNSDQDVAVGVSIDSFNHIVVGGRALDNTTLKGYATVSMFNQDGSWYKGFGLNGYSNSLSSSYSISPEAMVLDAQNNILFAGSSKTDISVVRFVGKSQVMAPIYYLLF